MSKLDKLRQKQIEKSSKTEYVNSSSLYYKFWNIEEGEKAVIRFLPDSHDEDDQFWRERMTTKLTFSGIKNHDENTEVSVIVPCANMWGKNKCLIQNDIQDMFRNDRDDPVAKKYYRKIDYLYQGLVVDSSLDEEESPENPIRLFTLSKKLHGIVLDFIMDQENEDMPTDYKNGVDFIIKKTKTGNYADYTTSQWSRKNRELSVEELTSIEEHGLHNLDDFLPKEMSDEEIEIAYELFQDSLNGELYDPDKYAKFVKPIGFNYDSSATTTPPTKSKEPEDTKKSDDEDVDDVEELELNDDVEESNEDIKESENADDILAKIRNRNNEKKKD